MECTAFRDLTVLRQPKEDYLIIACDSSGGIGPKAADLVKVDGQRVGYYAAHVVLAETIAAGAEPFLLINALAVEADPTGQEILKGIRRAAEEAGLEQAAITGSTEENIPVSQTALGIMALARAPRWPLHHSKGGDILVLAGIPRMGDEVVRQEEDHRLTLKRLLTLRREPPFTDLIKEILPVGSRGAIVEARALADTAGCRFSPFGNLPELVHASGGPSTCAILSLKEEKWETLTRHSPLPLVRLGKLEPGPPAPRATP